MATKKIGVVPHSIFVALDAIREEYGIKNKEWAFKSGLSESRISEFRKQKPHRVFTYDKAVQLSRALQKLTGRGLLRQEIKKRIEDAKTYREKAILWLLLGFEDDDDPRIKHVYENLKMLSAGPEE